MIETDLLGTLGNDLSAEKEGGGQGGIYLQITWNSGNVNLVDRLGMEILNKNSKIQMRTT